MVEDVDSPEDAGSEISRKLAEKKQAALADTIHAKDPYDNAFTDSWTVEEWTAFSEEERKAQIEEEYSREEEQQLADAENDSARNFETDSAIANSKALTNAAEQTADFARSLGFEVSRVKSNAAGDSFYLYVEDPDSGDGFDLRFSDHEQPARGSHRENATGGYDSKSDYSTVISDGKINLAGVWQFLRENRTNQTNQTKD